MKIQQSIKVILASAAMAAMATGASFADINPTSIVPTVTGPAPYTYTYAINVTNGETVTSGDFFTFVDVNGLVAGSETTNAMGWTAAESATGPIATGASGSATPAVDSAGITNVTFTYSGGSLVGQQDLGNFSFKSIYGMGTTPEAFTAIADLSPASAGIKNANLTTYLAPTPTSTVPEPASVVPFLLGGFGLLGLIVRKTRRTNGAAA